MVWQKKFFGVERTFSKILRLTVYNASKLLRTTGSLTVSRCVSSVAATAITGSGYKQAPSLLLGTWEHPVWKLQNGFLAEKGPLTLSSTPGGRLGIGAVYPPSRLPISITVPEGHVIRPLESPGSAPANSWIDDSWQRPEVRDQRPRTVRKEAARLIVIRRKKMNKHKYKKLQRRMKFIFAKIKLRRQIKAEKLFLNTQMAKIREAQKFDAKAFVADVLRRAKAEPLPTQWEGRSFPEAMIRQKMEVEEKRKEQEYLSILDKRQRKR